MSKNVFDISTELMSNAYPGRGIIFGRTLDNKQNVVAYFIMGRSENSRNRVFVETEDGIRTEAYDPAKMTDPSLIIYHPVRQCGGKLVVTNGDQTDTICEYLKRGQELYRRAAHPPVRAGRAQLHLAHLGCDQRGRLVQPVHPQELHLGPHLEQALFL